MELQQSDPYQQYIKALGWHVVSVDGTAIFYKYIPLFGTMAKIQRTARLPYLPQVIPILKKLHVGILDIEPVVDQHNPTYGSYVSAMKKFFRVVDSPYLPTKTICVNITSSEEKIFNSFSSAKRRAVRRAEKNGITIIQSHDIGDLIQIKDKAAGMLGSMTTFGIDKLWNIFYPEKRSAILLAKTQTGEIVGGVLLLFWEGTAYYWIAGATHKGKKLFAPTLLAWESMRIGKRYHCTNFDFVGVWDERKPNQYTAWKGFTKFKEGFGGNPVYYPLPIA